MLFRSLARMIAPTRRGEDAAQVDIYKVEPYVVCADVYAVAPHTGRGGWSWYTGSAGWLYRLLVESLLGLTLEAGKLRLAPLLPPEWDGYELDYRHRGTPYRIRVRQCDTGTAGSVRLDGVPQPDGRIPLHDDGVEHRVEVEHPRGK